MGIKFFIVALLAVCAVQGAVVPKTEQLDEEFSGVMQKLRENLVHSVTEGLNILEPLYEQILFATKNEIERGLLEIDAIYRNAEADIDAIADAANEQGVNVEKCLTERPALAILVKDAKKTTRKCMEEEIRAVNKVYDNAVGNFHDIKKMVSSIISTYVLCDSDDCRKETIREAVSQMFNVKDLVEEAVLDTKNQVENSISGFEEKCIAENRQNLRSEAMLLLESIKTCVDKKVTKSQAEA